MSKEKETDAATVLSQMSQLVGIMPSFELSSAQDVILEADAIGATCTLQPSPLDSDILFPLSSHHSSLANARKVQDDPYIGFDDAEHTYAANFGETSTANSFINCKQPKVRQDPSILPTSLLLSTSHNVTSSSTGDNLSCLICGKKFKTHHNLMVHIRFHGGEKPHMCVTCSKAFTTKSDLKRHSKIHSTDRSSRFECQTCNKKFRDQASLTRHQKIHNPSTHLKCEKCQKEFARSDSLKNHMKTHSESKPFKCHICMSEFTYRSSFNRHLLAHDTATMFICDVCGKTFRRSDYVDSHKKLVHSDVCVSKKVDNQNEPTPTQPSCPENSKSKRHKYVKSKSTLKRNSDQVTENLNAVPILISMAEQAAKPKKHGAFKNSNELMDSELMSHEEAVNDLPSPSNIGSDLIAFLDESSTEEDDTVCSDSDVSEDRLEILSDSELQE